MRNGGSYCGIIFDGYGISFDIINSKMYSVTSDLSSNDPFWSSSDKYGQLNIKSDAYNVIAIG